MFRILNGFDILLSRQKYFVEPSIPDKIFETNFSFYVKYVFMRTTGKVQFLFLRRFVLVLTKFSVQEEDWALGNNSMNFRDFSGICQFPKILTLKSFGNSWGNSYIPCLLLIITLRFIMVSLVVKRKFGKTLKSLKILWPELLVKSK